MREVTFLKNNADKWKRFEELLHTDASAKNPNEMTDLFVELTDDLAYSQTFYPTSKTTAYLNTITAKVHQKIYKNKKESSSRIITFWTEEVPRTFRMAHRELLISLLVFVGSMAIGVVSMSEDSRFVRTILGDGYVNMTEDNIKSGDPFGVYKQEDGLEMFVRIAFNNVMVSLRMFVAGMFFSVGTVYMLFTNGVMVGVFHMLFYQHNLLAKSIGVVWIHGSLEITAIIIAGGAGIVVGNSLLFPKTFSRRDSFMIGAKKGAKIVIGLVPIIIGAAVLESWVTRFTDMHIVLVVSIIGLSLGFALWYYVVYPIQLERKDAR